MDNLLGWIGWGLLAASTLYGIGYCAWLALRVWRRSRGVEVKAPNPGELLSSTVILAIPGLVAAGAGVATIVGAMYGGLPLILGIMTLFIARGAARGWRPRMPWLPAAFTLVILVIVLVAQATSDGSFIWLVSSADSFDPITIVYLLTCLVNALRIWRRSRMLPPRPERVPGVAPVLGAPLSVDSPQH